MTQEVTPSQAARDKATELYCAWLGAVSHSSTPTNMRCGNMDDHDFVQAFARFEEQARTATEREVVALREALGWYGEQARLARLIHSEGDAGRHALSEDGGKRAEKALALSEQKS